MSTSTAFFRWLLPLAVAVHLAACKTVHRSGASGVAAAADDEALAKLGAARTKWLQGVTYQSLDDYPTVASPGNEMLTFIFELPQGQYDVGHTALAVGNDFFDFGPVGTYTKLTVPTEWADLKQSLSFNEGSGFWKNPDKWEKGTDPSTITLDAVIGALPTLAEKRTMLLVPMEVTAEHAQNIRQWWANFYKSKPLYSIPGLQCTSTVIKSFEASDPAFIGATISKLTGANIWFPEATPPGLYAAKILDDSPLSWNQTLRYEHRAGRRKGQKLKGIVGVVGKELKSAKYKSATTLAKLRKKIMAGLEAGNGNVLDPAQSTSDSSRDSRDAASPGEGSDTLDVPGSTDRSKPGDGGK